MQLTRRIADGDATAKRRLVCSSLGLVHAVARAYRGRGVPLPDLLQEGNVGLIRAVERFDPDRGVKFSTYAVWRIRHAILDAIAAANLINIPATSTWHLAAVRRAESEFERLHHRAASDEAIAERTHLSAATGRSLRLAAHVAASLDEPVGEDGVSLSELVADRQAVDPSDSAVHRESCEEVRAMLGLLPERHREVLIRRYGLGASREHSHEEIGKSLGVSEGRSRQIEVEALRRLRSIAQAA